MNYALKHFLVVAALVSVGLSFSRSAAAQVDLTFGTNGTAVADVAGNERWFESFVLPNDKILTFVSSISNSQTKYYLVRNNADGTLDAGYGTNGIVPLSFPTIPTAVFTKAARQTNGKIILTGSYNTNSLIVSINEDGTLNTGFAGGGIQMPNFDPNGSDTIDAVGVQTDDKIVVSSDIRPNNYIVYIVYLVRYLPDGTLDSSFGNGGIVSHQNTSGGSAGTYINIYFQSNGKILTQSGEGTLKRYNADGTIDNGFPAIYSGYVRILIQPDDKILTIDRVDKSETLERTNGDIRVVRYTADGALDTGFGSGGTRDIDITNFSGDSPASAALEPNGQIVIIGLTGVPRYKSAGYGGRFSLARLSPNGQILGKFLSVPAVSVSGQVKILPSGKILAIYGNISNTTYQTESIFLTRFVGVPTETYYFKGVKYNFLNNQPSDSADVAVFRPSDLSWYYNPNLGQGTYFGAATDIRVPADYIGDRQTEIAVFRPSNGTWYIPHIYGSGLPAQNFLSVPWGQAGDIPVPEDYDGDTKSDIAVSRPSTGGWYIRNSSDNSLTAYQFGASEDKPVPGDYDGDGRADIAVFRPSNGYWYLLKSSQGFTAIPFGVSEDIPVQDDYDGDGKTDIAVRRPSSGYWYRINSGDASFSAVAWGFTTDKPVPADYDGDGKTDVAVWRPSNGQWFILKSTTNMLFAYNWGTSTDLPIQERK